MVGTNWIGTPAVGTGAVAHSSDGGADFTASTTEYTPLALTALSCPTTRALRRGRRRHGRPHRAPAHHVTAHGAAQHYLAASPRTRALSRTAGARSDPAPASAQAEVRQHAFAEEPR